MKTHGIILGIESSCDETGVAIYHTQQGLIAEQLYSQVLLHEAYGGVVPELASRDHIRKLLPLIHDVFHSAQLSLSQLKGIAYTQGPGLLGPLLMGATIAKSLGFALDIPTLGVHHMEGHLLAPFLETSHLTYPFVALLVSGGHTLLVDVQGLGCYQVLGESLDDAVGEAFDKTAKLMGLGYPGGARLSKLAESGNPTRFKFPRPMLDRPGLDFSFSGLKTFALNTWSRSDQSETTRADIAKAFELAVVDTLAHKCERALAQTGRTRLVMAGGVSANTALRARLQQLALQHQIAVFYPRPSLCTDNGAMIAYVGALRLQAGERDAHLAIQVRPRWGLDSLSKPQVTDGSHLKNLV